MESARILIRRLFSLRNLAPALVIIIALIGSLGLEPFGIQYTFEQIVLALLAILAIDALVERLDILTRIHEGVQSVANLLEPKTGSDAFLIRRDSQHLQALIRESRSDLSVAGITLDTIATLVDVFKTKLKEGCRIRIVALSPDGLALDEMAKYFGSDPDFLASRIRSNLGVIASNLSRVPGGQVDIRILDRVFTTGFVISDANEPDGRMLAQHYAYWIGVEGSPLVELTRRRDKTWFPEYLRQYEKAWEHATEFQYRAAPQEATD